MKNRVFPVCKATENEDYIVITRKRVNDESVERDDRIIIAAGIKASDHSEKSKTSKLCLKYHRMSGVARELRLIAQGHGKCISTYSSRLCTHISCRRSHIIPKVCLPVSPGDGSFVN